MKKARIVISIVLIFGFAVVAAALDGGVVPAEPRYALVIGNGAYANVSPLNNPVNDANDIATALQSLGFQVDKVLNGSLERMEDAVGRLKNLLGTNANACGFFYYAGHGVQSGEDNYLIPVNAIIPSENYLRQRALSVQAMLDELNDAENALNIVVLDACRDNPFSWSRGGSRGLGLVRSQPADSIIVYATSSGQTAADGIGRNGMFTGELLKHLTSPGLGIKEVFDRTGLGVKKASGGKQIPAVYSQFFAQAYLNGMIPVPQPVPNAIPFSSALLDMVSVAGGSFMMGSPTGLWDQKPAHKVTLSSFWMSRYEITQAQYEKVTGENPAHDRSNPSRPVESVTWYDAVEFCNKLSELEGLEKTYAISERVPSSGYPIQGAKVTMDRRANGYRLPTEAEWEYAARGGQNSRGYAYAGSNALRDVAWYVDNSGGSAQAVGMKAPNELGLYDLSGNVREWCWDWYGDYPSGEQIEPTGTSSGMGRVTRGGSNGEKADTCTVFNRCIFAFYNDAGIKLEDYPKAFTGKKSKTPNAMEISRSWAVEIQKDFLNPDTRFSSIGFRVVARQSGR